MSTYEKTLIPPLNFSMVDSGVYRSGFPNKKNHAFLQQLGLRSVLYLCHQEHRPENIVFFEENNIQIFQCPIDGNKVFLLPSIFLRPKSCDHRTGCVVGCLRKVQYWSLTSIIDEYCRFAGPRMRLLDQQFIEFFSPVIDYDASHAPRWLY
ncbi:hypothetical protein DYB37_009735 [Aphanomyces astaci]|uniref:Tyrosine-protein phosphatase domain-containing protein n=2 Tax=Aphanomyces astaci TaxID=112090 RepID=A0A397B4P0_APHAT|nr:hypothetical protein DYB36_003974 [Aphanomyces astaci]RHY59025.1 hypothetical protein DYB30_008300 [Aphanomyces astaci]RHY95248.1 hypothetical protein DYB35_008041 [Aphanomyces astaci]RHZ15117.1 hypothetical protein DYB37_009735 [Aphanomyces astaci]